MSGNTEITDIVNALKESEGSQELSPNSRARLVMQGIKSILPTYRNTPDEEKMLGYLISQAEKYLKDPKNKEASTIIANGLQNNLVAPYAA